MRILAQSRRFARRALLGVAVMCGWLAVTSIAAQAADDEAGFKSIFDGKSLDGWDGNPKFWRVEDGAITGQTTKENPAAGNTFCIWRQGEVDDFELKCEFKIIGHNSG